MRGWAEKHLQASHPSGASAKHSMSPPADVPRRQRVGARPGGGDRDRLITNRQSVPRGAGRTVEGCSCSAPRQRPGSEPRTRLARTGLCPAAGALDKGHLPSSPSPGGQRRYLLQTYCALSLGSSSRLGPWPPPSSSLSFSSLASYRRTFFL